MTCFAVRGALTTLLFVATPVHALDPIEFQVRGGDASLQQDLRAASLLLAAQTAGEVNPQDLFAAARAEYARLIGVLYAHGHYSPVITIRIDGREAASIAPLNAPGRIGRIDLRVDPGPAFAFSRAQVGPLAAGTTIPKGYAVGAVAESGVIREAAETAVSGWRDVGHALAQVAAQDLVADHARASLSADLRIDAGPRLRFGKLRVSGQQRMRLQRILKIAGLPEGDIYDPQELERAAQRLRRSGVFRSVSLVEDETVTAPDLLGIAATVVEEKPRRYSFGAELASSEGMALTGSWMHRNLWGGGERLKIQGNIAQIGAQDSGVDYGLDITLERPATFSPDTLAALKLSAGHLDEEDYLSDFGEIGLTFSHYFSENLTARAGVEYAFANVQDVTGGSLFRNLSVPLGVLWDRRDSAVDATSGFYLEAEAKPFLGFGTTDSGLRVTVDARAYRTFGTARPVTFAGRAQIGRVLGSDLMATPRDFLFYSGGAGTVRGQPYQSLGVSILRSDFKTGGTAFLGLSGEVRTKVTDTIGLVAFADAGSVGAFDFLDDIGDWHAGAGLGLRYDTGFGPIRFDIASPVRGTTGKGPQIYIGIGQAF